MPKTQHCILCGNDVSTWPCESTWDSEHRPLQHSEAVAAKPLDTDENER